MGGMLGGCPGRVDGRLGRGGGVQLAANAGTTLCAGDVVDDVAGRLAFVVGQHQLPRFAWTGPFCWANDWLSLRGGGAVSSPLVGDDGSDGEEGDEGRGPSRAGAGGCRR
jgi:hypothetical protein